MKDDVRVNYKNQSELLNGKDITLKEVQTIYTSLRNQHEMVNQEIVSAVDQNDYVRMTQLISRRKNIETALDDIKTAYKEDLFTSKSIDICILKQLKDQSEPNNALESVSLFGYTLKTKIKSFSSQAAWIGNHFSHLADQFLSDLSWNKFFKFADALKKEDLK